ncbi:class I tRNA ligase family protein [Acidobacteriota bacterium]
MAIVNYREDIRISGEVLSRTSENYRKIRNTWRFMFGVLSDFDPVKDDVADNDLREIDLFILHRLEEVKQKIFQSYKDFEYHTICHTISNFFTIELSSFYLNVMKDILYCETGDSQVRRAARSVIYNLLKDTLLIMAPILTFTTEEAWKYLPAFPGKEESIHLQLFPEVNEKYLDSGLIDKEKWERILTLRDRILKEIEEARNEKLIGDSLEAEINLQLDGTFFDLFSANPGLFKEICVVSKVSAEKTAEEKITVKKSTGSKCLRCWNWFEEDTSGNAFPEICPRCSRVIEEMNLETEK